MKAREIVAELNGNLYTPYRALQDAFAALYNRHLAEMPAGYTYLDLLAFARQCGWIVADGDGWIVEVPEVAGARAGRDSGGGEGG